MHIQAAYWHIMVSSNFILFGNHANFSPLDKSLQETKGTKKKKQEKSQVPTYKLNTVSPLVPPNSQLKS